MFRLELTQWFKLLYNMNCKKQQGEDEMIPKQTGENVVQSLTIERDFYYSKLHEMELLIEKAHFNPQVKEAINRILQFKP